MTSAGRPRQGCRNSPDGQSALPVSAVESVRTAPMRRAVFCVSKIVYVMEGAATISTAYGAYELRPGHTFLLGSGNWCSLAPRPAVRVWTVYADESFVRTQLSWALPIRSRVLPGAHPLDWSGKPLVADLGIERLRLIEPIWREMSRLDLLDVPPEQIAARALTLTGQAMELSIEALIIPGLPIEPFDLPRHILGNLSASTAASQVSRAAMLLRTRMAESWTVDRLANEVALSRTHLTRLFATQYGVAPIRYLIEVRLTEFTRLVEETDLTIKSASRRVGWMDSRVASSWFRRRFGLSPSQFRRSPHPFVESQAR